MTEENISTAMLEEDKRAAALRNITFLNEENWEEFIQQDRITLLSFLSGNHLGCREQIPLIRSFADKYGSEYNIAVIDASKCPGACIACQIDGIPMLVILRDGMVLGGRRGGFSDEDEAEFLGRLRVLQNMDMEKHKKSLQ